jgi:membrane-associated protein
LTDTLLALVPTYGVWLIYAAVALSAMALPVPASILVMTAGGFASTGDLVLWQVQAAALAGCMTGDQVAYGLARRGGAPLLALFRRRPKVAGLLDRCTTLLDRRGAVAVFLSRTVLSPLGPWMGYLAGALRLNWAVFTLAAGIGAACWAAAYTWLGYSFATRIAEIASLIGNALGVILAVVGAAGILWYLVRSYRAERARQSSATQAAP